MDTTNRYAMTPWHRYNPASPGLEGRIKIYLATHPRESAEQLLADALVRELDRREATEDPFPAPKPPTAEDLEIHARLCERLANLHRDRSGFWDSIRRLVMPSN
jgi:hypothetical protein